MAEQLTGSTDLFRPVAAGVGRLATVFVNLYAVDLPDGSWVLVDTGVPGSAWYVRRAAESRYGPGAKPAAIVLTHGHFDHSGNAPSLGESWDVPVYAHPLELPYLTGRSLYAPADPTPGGAISQMSRLFPSRGMDVGARVKPLPVDGSVPAMPGWRWVHTPGHSPGHVSLFRESDGVLLAGDAVLTVDLDKWSSQPTWPRELSRPPTPLTPDWEAACDSVQALAALSPKVIAAGHGLPMGGEGLAAFALAMHEPAGGRYSGSPAEYAPDGSLADVPPPMPDPLPRHALLVAAAAVAILVVVAWLSGGSRAEAAE